MVDITEKVNYKEYSREGVKEATGEVVVEMPLTIYVDKEELVTLLCTPERMDYLALGFLWSEGVINTPDEVKKIVVDEEKGAVWVDAAIDREFIKEMMFKRLITSGCGKGTTFYSVVDKVSAQPVVSDIKVTPEQVLDLMSKFQETSHLYKETHGVHSAALCTPDEILIFREDIGRHNAIDKILGECFMSGTALKDKVMLTSGRISSEVLLKTAKKGIPVLVSRTSPTALAVRLAGKLGVTLIGFVRGGKMRVYNHNERVNSEQ